MNIITDPAVRPFTLSHREIEEVLAGLGLMHCYDILVAVNELAKQCGGNRAGVRPDVIPLLEDLRIAAREKLPASRTRERFVAWSVWPCNEFYARHLTHCGDEFRILV